MGSIKGNYERHDYYDAFATEYLYTRYVGTAFEKND